MLKPDPENDPLVCSVGFEPASPEDVDTGFLGWVSCIVSPSLDLCGMPVRRLRTGRIKIQVRRRCRDMDGRLVAFDARARASIQEQIIANACFCVELLAIGVELPETADG